MKGVYPISDSRAGECEEAVVLADYRTTGLTGNSHCHKRTDWFKIETLRRLYGRPAKTMYCYWSAQAVYLFGVPRNITVSELQNYLDELSLTERIALLEAARIE